MKEAKLYCYPKNPHWHTSKYETIVIICGCSFLVGCKNSRWIAELQSDNINN